MKAEKENMDIYLTHGWIHEKIPLIVASVETFLDFQ
jgi:hypothetical protein